MLSLVVIALLPLLPAQESAPPESAVESAPVGVAPPAESVESAPLVDGAPADGILVEPAEGAVVEPTPTNTDVDACLALISAGKREEAQACYAARAARDDDKAAIARELADLVGALELTPPDQLEPPKPEVTLGELFLSGKAELIATSTLVGAYGAELAVISLMSLSGNGNGNSVLGGLLFIGPVLGGAAGLGASLAAVMLVPDLSTGDVNTVRSVMLLGTFNSIMLPIDYLVLTNGGGGGSATTTLLTMGMFAVQGVGVLAGVGVASFTDLHEGAGSFAISAGLWTSVLSILVADAFGTFKTAPQHGALLATAAANAGFIGGLVGAQWVPMTRAETWALDVGGGVGLLAGASLAVFARAPNPFVGYGTMAAGTVLGMGAGFAAARYLPPVLGGLPEIVAFAPILIDDVDPERALRGAVVLGRF